MLSNTGYQNEKVMLLDLFKMHVIFNFMPSGRSHPCCITFQRSNFLSWMTKLLHAVVFMSAVQAVDLGENGSSVTINGLLRRAEQLTALDHLRTVGTEWTSSNDCWDLKFPSLIFSYYITLQQGNLLSCWWTKPKTIMLF